MKITRHAHVLILPFLLGSAAWSAPEEAALAVAQPSLKPFPTNSAENRAFAKTLLEHALDADDAATSFQGTYIMTANLTLGEGNMEKVEMQLRTNWRVNEQGNIARENSLLSISGQQKNGKTFTQTLRKVDNGQTSLEYMEEEKKWSQTVHNPTSLFRRLFRPSVDETMSRIAHNMTHHLIAEQGVEGGVPTYVVRHSAEDAANNLRVVLNASDGSLRSLLLNTAYADFGIVVSDRQLNALLPDSAFEWKAPQGARQVSAGKLKINMGILGLKSKK